MTNKLGSRAAANNHANQLNRNNAAYWSSRQSERAAPATEALPLAAPAKAAQNTGAAPPPTGTEPSKR